LALRPSGCASLWQKRDFPSLEINSTLRLEVCRSPVAASRRIFPVARRVFSLVRAAHCVPHSMRRQKGLFQAQNSFQSVSVVLVRVYCGGGGLSGRADCHVIGRRQAVYLEGGQPCQGLSAAAEQLGEASSDCSGIFRPRFGVAGMLWYSSRFRGFLTGARP